MAARGHSKGGAAMLRIPVGFDPDTFSEIGQSADARDITFGERVRQLVELGLETEKEGACSISSRRTASSNSADQQTRSGRAVG
jgi:hypothetical protein